MSSKSKTHVHGDRDSHGGIVPTKRSNEGQGGPKEIVEGRPPTKENAEEPNPRRTPSRGSGPNGLDRVRQAAKGDKKLRFTALLHPVNIELLRRSYYDLKRRVAAGVDGVTWQAYGDGLEKWLADLHGRIHRGAYHAKPSRRVWGPEGTPKADGRQLPLGIAALEDRIVQHAVVEGLNRIWEEDFLDFSYGFRPGRSQHDALDALYVGITSKKVNYVKTGYFMVYRKTIGKRMAAKLKQIRQELRQGLHEKTTDTMKWLPSVVRVFNIRLYPVTRSA